MLTGLTWGIFMRPWKSLFYSGAPQPDASDDGPISGRLTSRLETAFLLSFLVLAGALAYLAVGVVATVVRDPQRWSKPDVYACLFIAAYVIGWIATECASPAIRDAFTTRQTFFRQFFELWLWLIVAQTWVGHGSWLFTVFMFAQIAWVAWRHRRAANRVQAVQAHAH